MKRVRNGRSFVTRTVTARSLLAADGIFIRVVDAYCVQPIDRPGMIAAGRSTGGRMITVEDHYAQGGLGEVEVGLRVGDEARHIGRERRARIRRGRRSR